MIRTVAVALRAPLGAHGVHFRLDLLHRHRWQVGRGHAVHGSEKLIDPLLAFGKRDLYGRHKLRSYALRRNGWGPPPGR